MPKPKSPLKPSGYDVVIRNTLAIKRLNTRIGPTKDARYRNELMTEKDRLIDEMQAACPHESVSGCDEVRSSLFGPDPVPTRMCTSCGCYEQSRSGFKALKPKRGRTTVTLSADAFSVQLGKTLIFTGINIKRP